MESKDYLSDPVLLTSRKTKWMRNMSREELLKKHEEQKFIAYAFIEVGTNYHHITKFFPTMEPKTYRCYVEAVNNQTICAIIDFLRYECNVQVEKLNRDQKRSMRTQLTKIKEWLGNRDSEQLELYYKFIRRQYEKSVEIKFEEALKLYKTIIQIIKSPYVNVLEAEELEKDQEDGSSLTLQEEKGLVILYIKWRDLTKVSDALCQTYGYELKWSIISVKHIFRELLNKSV